MELNGVIFVGTVTAVKLIIYNIFTQLLSYYDYGVWVWLCFVVLNVFYLPLF